MYVLVQIITLIKINVFCESPRSVISWVVCFLGL